MVNNILDGTVWYNRMLAFSLGDHKRKRDTLQRLLKKQQEEQFCDLTFVFDGSDDRDMDVEYVEEINPCRSRTTEPVLFTTSTQDSQDHSGLE
jgi:hypothetical protein